MYIAEITSKSKNKKYKCVLLRESYRENGKVKNKTIANLSHCKREEIEAIKIALAHKNNLAELSSLANDLKIEEGRVWARCGPCFWSRVAWGLSARSARIARGAWRCGRSSRE